MFRTGLAVIFALVSVAVAQPQKPIPTAITNARVVVSADKTLAKATVILRDGLIVDVVEGDSKLPPEALVIDGAGLTVYPGLIDAGSSRGFDAALRRSAGGPPVVEDLASDILAATKPDNRKGLTPEFEVRSALKSDEDTFIPWRKLGFTAELAMPEGGYISGQSTLFALSGATPRDAVLRPIVFQHMALKSFPGADYPRALMGVTAHCRQAFLDAGWHARQAKALADGKLVGVRPTFDPALDALNLALEGKTAVVFEADSADEIHRALDFAKEFGLTPVILGGRDAWKVKDRLKATDTAVILHLSFSESDDKERQLPPKAREERERKRKEEHACAAELNKAGVRIAFATHGLEKSDKFGPNLRKAIAAGLPANAALKALTESAANILGVANQIGTIAKGKSAHLFVTDGDFNDEKTKTKFVFADGIKVDLDGATKDEPRPERKGGGFRKKENTETPKTETPKKDEPKPEEPKTEPKKSEVPLNTVDQDTELDANRIPKMKTKGRVLIRNATILTAARNPRFDKADILVENGKIKTVGPNLPVPGGEAPIIDAEGMFVMPGIIDSHAHFSISGGVNEFSLSVVPEVRVRDVVDSEDVEIYRALAGGVTTARLLHGSANVIGGQDAVIKLKYGATAKELILNGNPQGIKFALGENVKRSDGRFPNTRMGVEAVLVRAFSEAQAYRKQWDDYKANKDQLPEPRRDLRLEALSDILKGDIKVHCHCYRSDEILMLLRVADKFGFKVQSLQHVLEGYKVASEIAAHGASCSLFSDWWAYKIEAFDAIPFAAALLNEAGATVCLKSDSNELVRHLYQESAKLIKYGGMSEEDALKAITLNPAKQLGIDGRTGSIEVGKDADLAIFNGHPLNGFARCEMTLVEGEVYFQRSDKLTPYRPAVDGPTKPTTTVTFPKFKPDGPILLRNVTIHNPGAGPFTGDVRIVKGKIEAVGKDLNEDGATVLNSKTLHVFPGLIDAGTQVGLTEIGSAKETADFSEGGDFQPDLRAAVAVNPESELIPVTRANGVLTAVVQPRGGVVGGQAALLNLAGWVPREMTVVEQLALHIDFPAESPVFRGDPSVAGMGRAVAKKQREEKIRKLKELFAEAKRYEAGRKANQNTPVVPRLEAMLPYVRGERPVIISADRKPEMLDALKLADELKIKIILSGATDAWKLTDELKKRDVPVIIGPVMDLPTERHDPYDAPYANANKLYRAGVRFCIRSTGSSNARNLPYEAAMAVSYGLPPEEAFKAVTIYPAQILGVADQLGSVEAGKRANLVLTNGDLLQPSTQVLGLFIDGKPLEPTSKHTRLYDKYLERLKEVKDGRAPLGTK
ncbi:MAG TPA: amidohydrolase family protein [Gemmataceae bacterium]|jgi:imidazolonepropionase-like amidohydrolase|nr:amidohydrolase family protein [Gemmataceae bacterium]